MSWYKKLEVLFCCFCPTSDNDTNEAPLDNVLPPTSEEVKVTGMAKFFANTTSKQAKATAKVDIYEFRVKYSRNAKKNWDLQ